MWCFVAVFWLWIAFQWLRCYERNLGVYRRKEIQSATVFVDTQDVETWAEVVFIPGTQLAYITKLRYRHLRDWGAHVVTGGKKGFRNLPEHEAILQDIRSLFPSHLTWVMQWKRNNVVKRVRRCILRHSPCIGGPSARSLAETLVPRF